MKTSIFFFLLFSISISINSLQANFTCTHEELATKFSLKTDVSNRTLVRFPGYGDLVVNSISFDAKRLGLIDPRNCVPEVFLNLDLSRTPFRYYHAVGRYKYVNCSAEGLGSFEQVPCLSGGTHHVYVVEADFEVPANSCRLVKNVEIPFGYNGYVSDDRFGLELTWDSATLKGCQEVESGWVHLQDFSIVVIVLAVMLCVKTYHSKKSYVNEHEKLLDGLEVL